MTDHLTLDDILDRTSFRPEIIKTTTFPESSRREPGYSTQRVDTFIADLAVEAERVHKELRTWASRQAELASLPVPAAQAPSATQEIADAIINATRSAGVIIDEAKKTAAKIVEEARDQERARQEEASAALEEARRTAAGIVDEAKEQDRAIRAEASTVMQRAREMEQGVAAEVERHLADLRAKNITTVEAELQTLNGELAAARRNLEGIRTQALDMSKQLACLADTVTADLPSETAEAADDPVDQRQPEAEVEPSWDHDTANRFAVGPAL